MSQGTPATTCKLLLLRLLVALATLLAGELCRLLGVELRDATEGVGMDGIDGAIVSA